MAERIRSVSDKTGELVQPGGGGRIIGPPKYQKFVAEKAKSQFSIPNEPRYSKPGGTPEPPAAKAPYVKPKAQYEIWSRREGKKVSEASSLKSARRVVDRKDLDYGAYDHYHKKIGE